jgi:hypothetical protein
LLDRLDDKLIKVICPLETYEPEEDGYAVIVPEGDEPPKPLCFVCGSAGIKQVYYFTDIAYIFLCFCFMAPYVLIVNSSIKIFLTSYLKLYVESCALGVLKFTHLNLIRSTMCRNPAIISRLQREIFKKTGKFVGLFLRNFFTISLVVINVIVEK